MGEKIISESFNTNPDTVFGLLVAILIFFLIAIGLFVRSFVMKLYKDWVKTREEEKKVEEEKRAESRERMTKLYEDNKALQQQNITVLTDVVRQNTTSNSALVQELRSHRESGMRIADANIQSIQLLQEANKDIKKDLIEIKTIINGKS